MNAIVPLDRLEKVLDRLGSPYDGERAAAALLASRMVHAAGLTWHDLLHGTVAPSPAPNQWHATPDWHALIAYCRRYPERLTPWETQFLASLARFRRPSPRQFEVLREIADRIAG